MPLLESSPSTSALVSAMRCGAFSGVRSSSCSVAKGTSSEVRERRTNFPVATVLVNPPLGVPFHQTVTNPLTTCLKHQHPDRFGGLPAGGPLLLGGAADRVVPPTSPAGMAGLPRTCPLGPV